MKQFILKNKNALTGIFALLLTGVITMSFQDSPFSYTQFMIEENFDVPGCMNDTLPEKEFSGSMKMKDFDKLQSELDKSLLQVNEEMKKIDFSKIQLEIQAALKSLDMEKIILDVERSLKSIDLDKMIAGISSSLKGLSPELKSAEMEKAMSEAKNEIEKAKQEIKDIDRNAIKKELEKAKQEIEKSRLDIEKIDMDKIMAEARQGIDKAKDELKLTREMFNELENDGLVDPKKGFELEYKDKSLYIDGKKQSEKVTGKYRKYFKKEHFKIRIEKE